ncbi:AAA family ATPase [Acidipropionibacterium virtanenii]|uniref:AAA family ATPase n=1 Tax=Acidipropionibacterium virtanenii TaxID=2057246 RepID=UPI001FEAC323|nr:ATP-binding protein [Acidipropionibacterium virtanenii]
MLARLATGDELGEALDGRRRGIGPVRGGSAGCAPHGSDRFTLGCEVELDDAASSRYRYEVTILARPELRVIQERLHGPGRNAKSGTTTDRDLVWAANDGEDGSPGIAARIDNGKRGQNPAEFFRDSRLVLTQVAVRLPGKNLVERAVLRAVDAVVSPLRTVFELDPVPSVMRGYSSRKDVALKRDGSNFSAAIGHLQQTDPQRAQNVIDSIKKIAANAVTDTRMETSTLDDVMFSLVEGDEVTPAREMSDGLLRFAAVATALQSGAQDLDVDTEDDILAVASPQQEQVDGRILMVIEEIENGLHPSQARLVLDMLRRSTEESGLQIALTTHSPAILDVLTGVLNSSIIVCYRGDDGHSCLSRLTDLEGYAAAMAHGQIGELVTRSELIRPAEPRNTDPLDFLDRIGAR